VLELGVDDTTPFIDIRKLSIQSARKDVSSTRKQEGIAGCVPYIAENNTGEPREKVEAPNKYTLVVFAPTFLPLL
jgi:hypothetical protein